MINYYAIEERNALRDWCSVPDSDKRPFDAEMEADILQTATKKAYEPHTQEQLDRISRKLWPNQPKPIERVEYE